MKNLLRSSLVCVALFSQVCAAAEALPPPNVPPGEESESSSSDTPIVEASESTAETAPASKGGQRAPKQRLWYRSTADWVASRTVRWSLPTEPGTRIISDGKRYDVTLGKRISLLSWGTGSGNFSFGAEGLILASLERVKSDERLTFATNTFDGAFGLHFAYATGSWITMVRFAHLSAHLVDNSPIFQRPIQYSTFWTEFTLGYSVPRPTKVSTWDLYFQGSAGVNFTAVPRQKNPRAALGFDFGQALAGPDSMALVVSGDAFRAGLNDQKWQYGAFVGVGYLRRPNNTHRPFRAGLGYHGGSDYRNQLYANKSTYTAFELQLEF